MGIKEGTTERAAAAKLFLEQLYEFSGILWKQYISPSVQGSTFPHYTFPALHFSSSREGKASAPDPPSCSV